MRVATDYLKGRILEVNLADLNKDEDQNYRKIKLQMLDVSGKHCLTNFYGMDMTTDKIRSLVKKWQVWYRIIRISTRLFLRCDEGLNLVCMFCVSLDSWLEFLWLTLLFFRPPSSASWMSPPPTATSCACLASP